MVYYRYKFTVPNLALDTFDGRWDREKWKSFVHRWCQFNNIDDDSVFNIAIDTDRHSGHIDFKERLDEDTIFLFPEKDVTVVFVSVIDALLDRIEDSIMEFIQEALDDQRYNVSRDLIDALENVESNRIR